MKQALLVGSIVIGGTHYALHTFSKNHHSAFCALSEEIWKDDNLKNHKKIIDYQEYLDSGALNTLFNKIHHMMHMKGFTM